MPEKMFTVTALARMRKHHGQEFTCYWCAGKRWDGIEHTVHVLTESQLQELKKEESDGYPIHFIEAVEVKSEPTPAPAPIPVVKSSPPPWAATK